jgi:HK97 family phage prohead protease
MNEKLQKALSKVRNFQVAFRAVDGSQDGKVVVEGMASTPDIDSYESVIEPSAYADSMRDYLAKNPVVLLQHKHDKPIGQVVEYSIDQGGLFVRAEITEDVDGSFSAIKNRVLRGFSVGFMPVSYEFRMVGEREILVLTKIDMKEISIVSVPANPNTIFNVARSMQEIGDDIRAVRAEETQDAPAAPVAPEVAPETTQPVAEPVQPTENPGEIPVPAQAEVVEPAKDEGVKAPETPAAPAPDAADPVKDPEPTIDPAVQAAESAKAEAEAKEAAAKAESAQLSQELEAARAALAAEQEARKAEQSKLSDLEKELTGVRAARDQAEERMKKMLTRGFSSGTPVNQSAPASYRMPSLAEIARGVHA